MGDSVKPTLITCFCVCVVRVVWLATVVRARHTLFMLCLCYPLTWFLAAAVFTVVYLRMNWLNSRIGADGR